MFRNFNNEARFSDEQSPPSSTPLGVAFDSQESSWIGLLSRPALSLLRKFRLWSATPAEISSSFMGEERELLRQLNELMPPAGHRLTYMRCRHDGTGGVGLLEAGAGGSVPWLTAVSVRNVGTQSPGDMELHQQPQVGSFSAVRALINQALVNSQEVRPAEGKAWLSVGSPGRGGSAGNVGQWWGSFMRGEDDPEAARTTPPEPLPVFELVLPENTGPPQLAHKGDPHRVQNIEGVMKDQVGSGEAGRPSAEQDHGYSSLEEELSQRGLLSQPGPLREEQQESLTPQMEETEEEELETEEAFPAPQCRNRSIAFIMGCPCSDDDDSSGPSEPGSDDDGFDSEGSSDLSDSSDEDEDDEASDSEPDVESQRLWTSLSRSLDPYNPRNFTAHLHTGGAPSAGPPAAGAPSAAPPAVAAPSAGPPAVGAPAPITTSRPQPSSPPVSASPPSGQDTWDDSTSASEVDEAESLRLLGSFSCSSDPYSPLNFKAPLRTRGPAGSTAKTRNRAGAFLQAPQGLHPNPAPPPEYRRAEAEERLDSGFSETATATRSGRIPKKVRFCEDVEEFFASCGEEEEDRRGPWEELARDRCRFLRRCQEVEQSIGFCLQPQHRRQVFQRLAALSDT